MPYAAQASVGAATAYPQQLFMMQQISQIKMP